MNAIKDSIKSGRTVVGTTVTPNVDVSILAEAGYDFLLFDTQHSAWEIKQLQPSIQTMRGKQAAPLVRVAANQAYQICFALDAGARGIVVPMVNTSAEAEAAVRACRYFPLGNRSNAGVRGEWGEFKNYRDYLDTVNNELVIVPMIETNQSLENLDAIASVPGVDVLLIGPSDLSIELGVPLDYSCDPISERSIKSRQPPQSAASPLGCIASRRRWTRTSSSRRGSSSSPCRGVPGRRLGSRTACPGSSANDGGPTESSTRSAGRQHSPRSPIDKRRRLATSGTAAPYFSAAVRRQRCQPCRQPQRPYAPRPFCKAGSAQPPTGCGRASRSMRRCRSAPACGRSAARLPVTSSRR